MLFSQCRTICLSYYQHSSHHRPLLYSKHLLILLFSHSLLSYFTSLDNTSDQDRAGAKRMHFPADHKSLFACSGSKVRRISILLNTINEEEFLFFAVIFSSQDVIIFSSAFDFVCRDRMFHSISTSHHQSHQSHSQFLISSLFHPPSSLFISKFRLFQI